MRLVGDVLHTPHGKPCYCIHNTRAPILSKRKYRRILISIPENKPSFKLGFNLSLYIILICLYVLNDLLTLNLKRFDFTNTREGNIQLVRNASDYLFYRVSLFFIFNFFVMKIPSLWLLNLVNLVLWSRRKQKQSGYDFLHWLISKPVHLKFCEKKSDICFYRNLNLRYWICIQLRISVTVRWLSSKLVFSKGVTFEGFVQLSWCFQHFLF